MYDFAIVGGGIVGLATAFHLSKRFPESKLVVLEKEPRWAAHQTGHNSGVIHSGIYYKPGSLKARLATDGNRSMVEFCRQEGIPHEVCGKLIVATAEDELPRLEALFRRGGENGLHVRRLTGSEAEKIEPHVRCLEALHVPSTGIVDFSAVCDRLAERLAAQGTDLRLSTAVTSIRHDGVHHLQTAGGEIQADYLIGCAGLQSDRFAQLDGVDPGAKIVPFRGEYYELLPERRNLVRGLIYPVPDPAFPFLGVHFTRMIDGSVHAGPNAVLAFQREGYRKRDISLRDSWDTLTFAGFWKLAAKYWKYGMDEMVRSFSKGAFVRSLQKMIPEIGRDDLVPAGSGVRAQALRPDGALVDDFLLVRGERSLHVCNAPSPAATASLEIGRTIVESI
ncbi:MAG: L-2-hydroxyglutarate oxidase [Thermoanaerobaculia bacterium]